MPTRRTASLLSTRIPGNDNCLVLGSNHTLPGLQEFDKGQSGVDPVAVFLGMGDAELMLVTAVGFLECMGDDALRFLEEHAEIAARTGDRFSEEAWRDIAAVAARLLRGELDLMYPCSNMAEPQKYRDEAARIRVEAETMHEAEAKARLLEIARHYDALAENVAKRPKQP
ncbi:MAG: hypothetical protein JWL84_1518 [Rhodospirillales bacterium]|jgi:hypothetical protein|nr:hypothetical protein [Rhodospirillales bacterium]